MCKRCYNSEMGLERRKEQNEAAEALKSQKFKGYQDPAYIAASKRCINADKAMQSLHSDYIWDQARKNVEGHGFYNPPADKRGKQS